ncbi:hypothetical protein B9N43_16535 [Denitratisoma sp. DHT3]|uniref:universal stress protein n=1 Tax=Denitratisoma sp. DHT3 TaxID=1981880 RepID=UPI0011985474|nr:universal stress protein [Denitratisoma sp. DHT3]QDX82702.1 hypothetical protein B9N43_16535 [Denitratisoma sp. DHT3]
MTTFKSILAATDFSDDARRAVDRAASLAVEQGGELELLHVMSGPSLKSLRELFQLMPDAEAKLVEDAQATLNELASTARLLTGTGVAATVKVGHVLDEILAASRQRELLVLGGKGSNPLRDLILGTTAERLLNKCRQPVLVVKQARRGPYQRVLVPVDFSPHSAIALARAIAIAPTAEITLVHAFEALFEGKLWLAGVSDDDLRRYRNQARQKALASIDAMIQGCGRDSDRIYRTVERGSPAPVILAKEAEFDADLIVVGKHGQLLAEELLLGSVTRHVLADSKCDVLVVQ